MTTENTHLPLLPHRLVAAMSAFVGVLDHARFANPDRWNRGLARDLGLAPGDRWDVALVQHCGYWSHYDHACDASHWPIPIVQTPEDLALFAASHALLRSQPIPGDIWLQFSPSRERYVRAGVVAGVMHRGRWKRRRFYYEVLSIEGDTGNAGELGGGNVLRIARRISPWHGDLIVRWADARQSSSGLQLAEAA